MLGKATLVLVGILLGITLLLTWPAQAIHAQALCQDLTGCTRLTQPNKIGTYNSCDKQSETWECSDPDVQCYYEYYNNCQTLPPVNICNAPPATTYNCSIWCEANVPQNTTNRAARIQDCITNSCRDAKGNPTNGTSGDYTCPVVNGTQQTCDTGHGCVTPIVASTPITCTGNASDGQPISCQSGYGCLSGYTPESGKTCGSNSTCCKILPTCQCGSASSTACGQNIGYTNGPAGTACRATNTSGCGKGDACATAGASCQLDEAGRQACISGSSGCSWTACSNSICGGTKVCRYPDGSTAGSAISCSPKCAPAPGTCITNITSVGNTNATGTASGDIAGYDRADWFIAPSGGSNTFLGTNTSFSATANGLLANKGYQMYATLWSSTNSRQPVKCSAGSFTTSQPPAITSDLQCWGAANLQSGQVARWVDGTGTGQRYDANLNLPNTPNHKVGEGCYRPGATPSEPTPGKVAGRIWLKDTPSSTPRLITDYNELSLIANPLQMWLYSPSAPCPPFSPNCRCINGFVTADNGGYICQFDPVYCQYSNQCNGWGFDNANFAYVFSSNDVGFIAQDNPNLAEYVQIYYFPLGYKLVGYYSYQERTANTSQTCTYCNSDCSTDPNNYTCAEDGGCGKGSYCGNYDTVESNVRCERTTAQFHEVNPNNVVRGQIYTVARVECQPDAPPFSLGAVYDLVFEKEARYQVSGTIFIDTNKNAIQDNGETGFNGALLALAGPASNFSMTSGAGGAFSLTSLDRGNYTLSLTVPGGYLATTPASSSFVLNQDTVINFGITPNNTITGKVVLDVNNDLCASGTSGPGFAGVRITIIPTAGGVQRVTQSSGSGLYSISGLPNGNFSIQATPTTNRQILSPANAQYVTTLPNPGPFDFCISQIAPWIQTEGASVHGRRIDLPGGP